MGTLFDYIDWRGDISFDTVGVGEVDNMIFSQICYIDFKGMVPASTKAKPVGFVSAVKRYVNAHKGEAINLGAIMPPEVVNIAVKAARSLRFSQTSVIAYVNKVSDIDQKQFSAITFLIGEDECFVAFRGTDDTIVGWKESFNMSFMCPIPAQTEAVKYIERIAEAFPDRRIYVGGHSKGGNLAVYGAVKCSELTNSRIVAVYNNDGPGFNKEFIESEEYARTRERIRTLVPQTSIVGMLLEHEENYDVVKSSMNGLLQHNAFSWEVMGGRFVRMDTVTDECRRIDTGLKTWLDEMSMDERKQTLDSLYEILSSTNAKTLTDLNSDRLKLIKAWNELDPLSKKYVKRCVMLIVRNTKKQQKD